jgi:hypothetical protein
MRNGTLSILLKAILVESFVLLCFLPANVFSEIDTIYLIPMSHLDIGFTATPQEVADEYKEIIDEAIEYAETDPDFKYTVETLWQLEQWLRRSSPQDIDRLRSCILQGRIGLSATYHTPHTAAMAMEEVNRFLYPARLITENLDLSFPRSAVLDDVPGYSWALPDPLRQCGIDRLMTGTNTSLGGEIDIPVKDTAFFWEGADSSRVLTWLSRHGYAEGYFHYGFLTWDMLCDSLPDRIAEFEDGDYPYDAIAVMYGFDNAHTGLGGVNLAREWNDNFGHPSILCGTVDDFFDHLQDTYGDGFSVYRGDWSGCWDKVSICTPASLGLVRSAQAIIPAAEAFNALASILDVFPDGGRKPNYLVLHNPVDLLNHRRIPGYRNYQNFLDYRRAQTSWSHSAGLEESRLDLAWKYIVLFNEHSGGGGSWPGMLTPEQVRVQNVTWVECAKRAHHRAEQTGMEAVRSLSMAIDHQGAFITVFNGRSFHCSGPVEVSIPASDNGSAWYLKNPDDDGILTIETEGKMEFVARDVPPFGYRIYELEKIGRDDEGISIAAGSFGRVATNMIESDIFRLEVDLTTGFITSLIDKRYGRELVDNSAEFDFGGLIKATNRQHVFGFYRKVYGLPAGIEVTHPASDMHRMKLLYTNTPLEWIEFTLVEGIPVVYITESFNRALIPYTPYEMHSRIYGLTFSFNGSLAEVHYGGPAGSLSPGKDLLPGAFGISFCIDDWIDFSIDGEYGITWSSRENLVHEFGSLQWLGSYEPEAPNLTVRVCSHMDEVLYKGDVIGEVEPEPDLPDVLIQHQAFSPYEGDFDPVCASLFGASFRMPLAACYVEKPSGGSLPDSATSLISFSDSENGGAFLTAFKLPLEGDGVVLRIKETAGLSHEVEVWSDFFDLKNPTRVDPVERPMENSGQIVRNARKDYKNIYDRKSLVFSIKPYESLSVRCDIEIYGMK